MQSNRADTDARTREGLRECDLISFSPWALAIWLATSQCPLLFLGLYREESASLIASTGQRRGLCVSLLEESSSLVQV